VSVGLDVSLVVSAMLPSLASSPLLEPVSDTVESMFPPSPPPPPSTFDGVGELLQAAKPAHPHASATETLATRPSRS
jgi:hypothetical protein